MLYIVAKDEKVIRGYVHAGKTSDRLCIQTDK